VVCTRLAKEKMMGKACGNPKCSVSTGIHDGLTFGSGDLDPNGFWEFPCAPCARLAEQLYPEDGECWPFKPQEKPTREQMLLAMHHMLEDTREELGKALVLLKSLVDTVRDLEMDRPDPRFEHNLNILEGEVAGAVACAKDDLGKVEIPEE
jgi:hypothetical protein